MKGVEDGIILEGFVLMGSFYDADADQLVELDTGISQRIECIVFCPVRSSQSPSVSATTGNQYACPVFLPRERSNNDTLNDPLFLVPIRTQYPKDHWTLRGSMIVCSSTQI
jgi:hypothetical protein